MSHIAFARVLKSILKVPSTQGVVLARDAGRLHVTYCIVIQTALKEGPAAANPLCRRPQAARAAHCTADSQRISVPATSIKKEYLEASTQLTPRRVPQASTQLAGSKSCKLSYPDTEIPLLQASIVAYMYICKMHRKQI